MEPIGVTLAILAFLLLVVPAALLPLIGGAEPEPEPVPVVARSSREPGSRRRLAAPPSARPTDGGRIAA
jgi:hypothetical protein